MEKVQIEIEKNKFLNTNFDNAIEIAVNEYFKNGKCLRINGKEFDIMEFGNWKSKLVEN